MYSSLWLNQPEPVRVAAHLNEKTKQYHVGQLSLWSHTLPLLHMGLKVQY